MTPELRQIPGAEEFTSTGFIGSEIQARAAPWNQSLLPQYAQFCRLYGQAIDQFLRDLGGTEDNVHEFEFREWPDGRKEVWRLGAKVGEIEVKTETENGIRLTIECRRCP